MSEAVQSIPDNPAHLVTGEPGYSYRNNVARVGIRCIDRRRADHFLDDCGPEGKLWEQRKYTLWEQLKNWWSTS